MYVYPVFQRPEPFSTGSEAQGDRHDRGDHRDRDRGEPAWANSQAESAHRFLEVLVVLRSAGKACSNRFILPRQ